MIKQREVEAICAYLNIPEAGRRYLRTARTSPPSRLPSKGFGNIIDIIASRKMTLTVKSESRHIELPFLLNSEFSVSILEIWDQPPAIKLLYRTLEDRNRAHYYTPDFLVIENSHVYFAECKPESKLFEELRDRPYLFTQDDKKAWICPPAQEAAAELGFEHRIYSDKDFPPNFTRNCIFLFNFIDNKKRPDEEIDKAIKIAEKHGGRISLKELTELTSQDVVVQAILNRKLHADLRRDLLCLPDKTWLYTDKTQFDLIAGIRRDLPATPLKSLADVACQSTVFWGTEQWDVLNVSMGCSPNVTLRKGDQVEILSLKQLKVLFEKELVLGQDLNIRSRLLEEKILSLRAADLEIAYQRMEWIRRSEIEKPPTQIQRSLRRWKSAYSEAQELHGYGILGLVPEIGKRGNRTSRLSDSNTALIEAAIANQFLSKRSPTGYSAYQDYLISAEEEVITPVALSTFYKRIQKIETGQILMARQGNRAAYAHAPQPRNINMDDNLPTEGDFIFEIAHVDHTKVSLVLWSALNNEPIEQTLWLSAMLDAHSRMILAIYITLESPSYRSTMMLLRECFRRHGRLPWWIVCDGGADFRSAYFEKTAARIGYNIRHRKIAAPRDGSSMERLFGISETELILTLEGNLGNQKLGRGQSSSHNPHKRAVWTPDSFYSVLKDWAYITYPDIDRGGIREKPITRFERSKAQYDELPGCRIESPEDFYLNTLPDVKNGLTLNKNQCTHRGITYRLSEHITGYNGGKLKIEARYDPYDLPYILGLVQGRWVRLFTQDNLVRACKERGIILAHMEVFPRQTRHNQRYNKVPEAALIARRNNTLREQHLFTQRQALSESSPLTLPSHPPLPIEIDLQDIPNLSVSFMESK